jgi:peptide/nickel transport system permease protein
VPTLLVIVVLNFGLLQLAPGDAADVLAGEAGSATPEYMAQLRQKFGLDQPVHVQLAKYVRNILSFDLGFSFRHNQTVAQLILARLGPTLLLMVSVLLVAVVVGVLMGALAARHLNRWQDSVISTIAVLTYATPVFWAGLMLIVLLSVKLGWFPTSGMESVAAFHTGWARIVDIAHHLVLPVVTLTLFYLALYTRLMRASVIEQSTMDYVTTARAKGLNERQVLWRHLLRNACLPVLTMAGVQAGALLGGAVVVETVFAWPGIGRLLYEGITFRDFPVVQGVVVIGGAMIVMVNLLVDILYALIDPRIRLES